jgi:hypothetical protein
MRHPLFDIFIPAVLTFASYAALIQVVPFKVENGQNQADTNMIRAQNFLAKPNDKTVLVGSSLTFRLPLSVLGSDIANIAVAGGASNTGLAIIVQSKARPKLVLVEINPQSSGPPDTAAIRSLLRFPEMQLRRSLRAFRTGYDPVNIAERGIQTLLQKGGGEEAIPQGEAMRRLIADQKNLMSRAPDIDTERHRLGQTADLIADLEAGGIQVGFFEMPIDSSLTNLPAEKIQRDMMIKRFPPNRFCWLTLVVPEGAHTLDGIHLTGQDAEIVAREITNQSSRCFKH